MAKLKVILVGIGVGFGALLICNGLGTMFGPGVRDIASGCMIVTMLLIGRSDDGEA